MPGANTLAYLASLSAMKKKSFITLTPVVFVAGCIDKLVDAILAPQQTDSEMLKKRAETFFHWYWCSGIISDKVYINYEYSLLQNTLYLDQGTLT